MKYRLGDFIRRRGLPAITVIHIVWVKGRQRLYFESSGGHIRSTWNTDVNPY